MTKKILNGRTTITHEEINLLPLGAFDGPVAVISDPQRVQGAFEEIRSHTHVGFDTETKPVFVKGRTNKVAILQIALPEKVFLIRLKSTGITPEIAAFFEDTHIHKIGVAIRDDIKALQLLRKFKPAGFVELTTLTRSVGLEVESVKKLAGLLLGFRISKSAQTSNWEAERLDEKQISYAATDAWVCLEVYQRIMAHARQAPARH